MSTPEVFRCAAAYYLCDDSQAALADACAAALEQLGQVPNLALLFFSPHHREAAAAMAETALTLLGPLVAGGLVVHRDPVEAAGLPILAELSRKEEIRFAQPIQVRIVATLAAETVSIQGEIRTGVNLRCSRCLTPFDLKVRSEFAVTAVAALAEPSADAPDHRAVR